MIFPYQPARYRPAPYQIARYQRVLFYALLAGIAVMAVVLFYERQRFRDRLSASDEPVAAPIATHVTASSATVTLDLASDLDGTIRPVERQVALPGQASFRARALLERLMAEYALPESEHRLGVGPAIDDVFLLPPPARDPAGAESPASGPTGTLAVINLRGAYLSRHPSGVQAEMLSLLSMLGTLHANFPEITEVRFLVDGSSRETLAGHVDLERIYPAVDTAVRGEGLQPALE